MTVSSTAFRSGSGGSCNRPTTLQFHENKREISEPKSSPNTSRVLGGTNNYPRSGWWRVVNGSQKWRPDDTQVVTRSVECRVVSLPPYSLGYNTSLTPSLSPSLNILYSELGTRKTTTSGVRTKDGRRDDHQTRLCSIDSRQS